jgi:hypothetical protein
MDCVFLLIAHWTTGRGNELMAPSYRTVRAPVVRDGRQRPHNARAIRAFAPPRKCLPVGDCIGRPVDGSRTDVSPAVVVE